MQPSNALLHCGRHHAVPQTGVARGDRARSPVKPAGGPVLAMGKKYPLYGSL